MAEVPRYVIACLHTGRLALLAILVSAGIVLQILVTLFVAVEKHSDFFFLDVDTQKDI